MGVYLAISDGTTTVDLSADYINNQYVPMAGAPDEEWVTESGLFRFDQGVSAWRTDIQNIGKLFTRAQEWHKSRTGNRVFIKFKWQSGDDAYRSEVATGLVVPDRQTLGVAMANAGTPTYGLFDIQWTRRNYWEDDTERTLFVQGFNVTGGTPQIYNSYNVTDKTGEAIGTAGAGTVYAGTLLNTPVEAYLNPAEIFYSWNSAARTATVTAGTTATSGGAIAGSGIASGTINYTNGIWGITFSSAPAGTFTADYRYGYGNYLNIPGTAVAGDLPAPVKLDYLGRYHNMFIASTYGSPASWTNAYEVEEVAGLSTNAGTEAATVTASGGTYVTYNAGTASELFLNLVPTSQYLAENDFYTPLFFQNIGSADGGTNTYWKQYVRIAGGFTYESEQVRFTNTTGIHKMPPLTFKNSNFISSDGTAMHDDYRLYIQKIDAGGGSALLFDFVQFMPTLGGYCETFPEVFSLGSATVVDGINERVYHYVLGANPAVYYDSIADYGWVTVCPGQANRIYTLVNLKSPFTATPVTVTYRPRRRVI